MVILLCMLASPLRSPAAQGPCAADVKKFCPNVQGGGGRIRKCLSEHQSELSAACKEKIGQVAKHASACEADIAKFCKDVQPGQGRIVKCLDQHQSELSPACGNHLAARGARQAPGAAAKKPGPTAAPKSK